MYPFSSNIVGNTQSVLKYSISYGEENEPDMNSGIAFEKTDLIQFSSKQPMILLLNVVLPDRQEHARFNFLAMMLASELAITATARNEQRNQSCLYLEGEAEQLKQFLYWCKTQSDCTIMDGSTTLADHVA
jgi:hypothetical protein